MPDFAESYSEDGFARQRRNLVVGSVVLFLVNVADIHVRTDGAALGIPVHISRPDALHIALLVGVVYWAVRFYQYQGARPFGAFNVATWDVIRNWLTPHALDYIVPKRPDFVQPEVPEGARAELRPHNVSFFGYSPRGMRASVIPTWFVFKLGEDGSPQLVHLGEHKVFFKGPLAWKVVALAYWNACVRTPAFTDHYLPYVFFGVAVAVSIVRLLTQ